MRMRRGIMLGLVWAAMTLAAAARTADEQMQFADGLYLRGLYDMAVQEYLLLIRDHPDYPRLDAALFRVGECYRQAANPAGAERFYQRVTADYPAGPFRFKAELRRAELFLNGGQYRDAARLFDALLKAGPPPEVAAAAGYYRGYSLVRDGARPEAEQALRRVIADHPESPFCSYACLALAEQYRLRNEKPGEQATLYRQAAARPATPRVGAEAEFQMAELAYRAGDYAQSAERYRKLLEHYPDDPRVGEAALQAAWSFHHRGQFAAALQLAERFAARAGAEDEERWLYLQANGHRGLTNDTGALRCYQRLLERYPRGARAPAAAYEQMTLLYRRGDYAAAVQTGAAHEPPPDVAPDFYLLLAGAEAALTHRDAAAAHCRAVADRYPDSEQAPVALFQLGRLRREQERWTEAAEAYEELADRHARHTLAPDALLAAAWCRAKAGQGERAGADWDRLLEEYADAPQAAEALFQKGMTAAAQGDDKAAQAALNQLLRSFPGTSFAGEAHYALGVIQDRLNQPAAAERELRAALRAALRPEQARQARYRLALVLQQRGAPSAAADELQALLPDAVALRMPPELLEWLARYQLEAGALTQAVAAARALADLAPEGAGRAVGRYVQGRACEALGRQDDAAAAYRAALAGAAPGRETADAALHLADLSFKTDGVAAARAFYEKAAELASGTEAADLQARSYAGLGDLEKQQGNWDEAARYFMSVAVLFDDAELTPRSLYEAAAAFGQAGRAGERDKVWAELQERYPDSPWARRAQPDTPAPRRGSENKEQP